MYNKTMEITSGQLCDDLFALLRCVKSALLEVAEEHELTPPQLAALYAILKGATQMGQVAQTLHCDASNATGIIDKLVARDLVVRTESAQDRRVKVLQLTVAGRQMITEIIDKLPRVTGCSKLSAQECIALHTTIAKIAD